MNKKEFNFEISILYRLDGDLMAIKHSRLASMKHSRTADRPLKRSDVKKFLKALNNFVTMVHHMGSSIKKDPVFKPVSNNIYIQTKKCFDVMRSSRYTISNIDKALKCINKIIRDLKRRQKEMNKTNSNKNNLLQKVDLEKVNNEADLLVEVYNGLDYLNYIYGDLSKEKKFTYRIIKNMVDVAVKSKLPIEEQGDVWNVSEYIRIGLEKHNYKSEGIHMVRQYVCKKWNDTYPFPF